MSEVYRSLLLVACIVLISIGVAVPTVSAQTGTPTTASIAASASSGAQNTSVRFSLAGFAPNVNTTVFLRDLDAIELNIGEIKTNVNGQASLDVFLSSVFAPGPYTVIARSYGENARQATTSYTLNAGVAPAGAATTLTVSATSVDQGGCLTFTGTGYSPNAGVSVWSRYPDGSVYGLGMLTTNPTGGFSDQVCVGGGDPRGNYTYTAYQSSPDPRIGTVNYRVNNGDLLASAPSVALTANPNVASAGASVTISGSGFGNQERFSAWLTRPNGVVVTLTETGRSQVNGTVSLTFTVPQLERGRHYISLYGASSGVRGVAALDLVP